jgi:hypothetical protein
VDHPASSHSFLPFLVNILSHLRANDCSLQNIVQQFQRCWTLELKLHITHGISSILRPLCLQIQIFPKVSLKCPRYLQGYYQYMVLDTSNINSSHPFKSPRYLQGYYQYVVLVGPFP